MNLPQVMDYNSLVNFVDDIRARCRDDRAIAVLSINDSRWYGERGLQRTIAVRGAIVDGASRGQDQIFVVPQKGLVVAIYTAMKELQNTALVAYKALRTLDLLTAQDPTQPIPMGIAAYSPKTTPKKVNILDHSLRALQEATTTGQRFVVYGEDGVSSSPNDISYLIRAAQHLYHALQGKQSDFLVHYQPKKDLNSEQIRGNEALARLTLDGKPVRPDIFIRLAERLGMIRNLTERVVYLACTQTRQWNEEGQRFSVAVNISPYDLPDHHLIARIGAMVDETGFSRNGVNLEITEGKCDGLTNEQIALQSRRALRAGFHVSLDDAFTDSQGLERFDNVIFGELKLDYKLMNRVAEGMIHPKTSKAVRLAERIAQMTRELPRVRRKRRIITGEGVPNKAMRFVYERGICDLVQSWDVSRPLPPEEYVRFIHDNPHNFSLRE
ncbi:TPA: EAL domain-containing protein [Candidatus Woesearchaeota archaeon]|nr:EAL domain-containing protein [Candidatus Woesearchaeota archaeon]